MTAAGWDLVHVDLVHGLSGLVAAAGTAARPLVAELWWRELPLGRLVLACPRAANAASLCAEVSECIAPAVEARLRVNHLPVHHASDPLGALDHVRGRTDPATVVDVSVVVCTRDRPQPLARCLDSLTKLAPRPLEILVVDNHPQRSETREVVERFPEVRYVAEPQPGLSVARNTGVRRSRGATIAFTDDDTTAHRGWLGALSHSLDEAQTMVVTGCVLPAALDSPAQVAFELGLGGFSRGYVPRRYGVGFFSRTRRYGAPTWEIGAGANMAIRREAFERVGLFDERLGAGAAGCSEDSELWYRLLAQGWHCVYEPAAVVFHHHRDEVTSLHAQQRDYVAGHVAALFVQFARHHHWGNLRRVALSLPRHMIVRAVAEWAGLAPLPPGTLSAEMTGYLQGLRQWPLAFQGRRSCQSGENRHRPPSRSGRRTPGRSVAG